VSKRAVITGISGQDGSYLAELLLEKGYHVWGLVRPSSLPDGRPNLDFLRQAPRFHEVAGDLLSPATLHALADLVPDEFYHLAAYTHVGSSFADPLTYLQTNTLATAQLLEELRRHSPRTRLYFAGSSETLPENPEGRRQGPEWPRAARSPYAASKLAAQSLCEQYRDAYRMFISVGLVFNHESPRRPASFVTQRIARGCAHFAATGEPFTLADLNPSRDWHHARDTVRGIHASLQHDFPATFVLASGESHTVAEFLAEACAHFKIDPADAVRIDSTARRPLDVPYLCGDPGFAEVIYGWRRHFTFSGLVRNMCEAAAAREPARG